MFTMVINLVTSEERTGIMAIAHQELEQYLHRIFGAVGQWACSSTDDTEKFTIHIYKKINLTPALEIKFGGNIPQLTEQGFLIRKTSEQGLLLLGGSEVAVLWAVYQLAECWGVIHTLQEDIFPSERLAFFLPDINKKFEPRQKSRSWRIMNALLHGPEGWSLKQQKKFIGQLAKQKYNGVLIVIWPQQPFIDYNIDGVSKKSAYYHFGMQFPVTAENIGRELLGPEGMYVNPEFRECENFAETHKKAAAYITEIICCAKSYGMRAEMSINLFDLPKEYGMLLEKPSEVKQAGTLTVSESGDLFGENHIRILKQVFEAYISTYPDVDIIQFQMPEHARNVLNFNEAWESLKRRAGLPESYDIEKLLTDPSTHFLAAGGAQRAENEGRMTIVLLEALHRVIETTGIDQYSKAKGKKLCISAGLSCPSILPILANALWPDAYMNIQFGYTSSRSVRSLRVLEGINTERVKVEQILTLQDDNVGSFPQFSTRSISRLLEFGIEQGWNGYITRFWPIGDLDPVAHYLSKASWEQSSVQEAYESHIAGIYGAQAVVPIDAAFHLLEDATAIMDLAHLSFLFPRNEIMSSRIGVEKTGLMDEALWHVKAIYDEVYEIFRKLSRTEMKDKGRENLSYMRARVEFARKVFEGVYLIECGNKALGESNKGKAAEYYKQALARFENGLEALARNARDDSDIAVLAIHYHLLVREVKEKMEKSLSQQSAAGGK